MDPTTFPNRLVDAIATQLRTAITQRAGTNGHCYGMALTAQRYFARPRRYRSTDGYTRVERKPSGDEGAVTGQWVN